MGVAVQYLLERLEVVVEPPNRRRREQPVHVVARGRSAPAGEGHRLAVVALRPRQVRRQFPVRGDPHAGVGVGNREVDGEVPLRTDAHAADDHVELPGEEGRDDPVPRGRHELDAHPHVRGELRRDVHLEADELAVPVAHRPRFERRDADLQGAAPLDRLDHALGRGRRWCASQLESGGHSERHERGQRLAGPRVGEPHALLLVSVRKGTGGIMRVRGVRGGSRPPRGRP